MKCKYNNCKQCKFYNYPVYIFPCNKCEGFGRQPVNCLDCRFSELGRCKKGVRPCNKFQWS